MDPVSNVHRLKDEIYRYSGAEHCRLDIFVSNQSATLSFEKHEVKILELTDESFAKRASRPDVFHFIDNNVPVSRPDYEKSIFQEFRSFPHCASLFAFDVPMSLQKTGNRRWGTLVLGHSMAGHFTEGRVKNICMILDAFIRSGQLPFLTDFAQTIYELQSTHEAKPFADIVTRFLKNSCLSVGIALLNAKKDRAVMFGHEVKSFEVSPQTLLYQRMARDDSDVPSKVIIPPMIEASGGYTESELKMLMPVNPMISSHFLVAPLRKPISTSLGPPMMLTLSDSSPRDRCMGMLYFEVHRRVCREFSQYIIHLAPILASVLTQRIDIAKDIEHITDIQPRQNIVVQCPDRMQFLERLKDIRGAIQESRRQEWKTKETSLDGLQLVSVISQRRSGAILKGSLHGRQVAVKIMFLNTRMCSFDREQRELEIIRSVKHKNIAKTLDHKVNVLGHQILKCCGCTCRTMQSCPYHDIQKTLSLIVSPEHVLRSLWDMLIMEYYDETLSTLIHHWRLFALPPNGPRTRHLLVDWKEETHWQVDVTLKVSLELAEAMCYLHSIGIVFGDLNPENVLIKIVTTASAVRWIVKLGDFGSSCIDGRGTIGSKCTPAYCPPEHLTLQFRPRLHKDGCSGDVYAFGVLLWEMVMGQRPFSEFVNNSMRFQKHIESNGRCEYREGFPEELRLLIDRCWHQIPRERPTFEAIVEELKVMVGLIK